jgi:hypothetical protein
MLTGAIDHKTLGNAFILALIETKGRMNIREIGKKLPNMKMKLSHILAAVFLGAYLMVSFVFHFFFALNNKKNDIVKMFAKRLKSRYDWVQQNDGSEEMEGEGFVWYNK